MKRVAGIGCRAEAVLPALQEVLALAAGAEPVAALATLEERMAVVRPLAEATGLPLIAIPRGAVAGLSTPSQSPRIAALFGTGCVAEAVALVAAGPGARIITLRHTSTDGSATAAIALCASPEPS